MSNKNSSALITIRGLEVTFPLADGMVTALKKVDLDISNGEVFVLLGPSGCGKTTMLRTIAGLERPAAGTITVDGEIMTGNDNNIFVLPNERPMAMVFQSYAMWPHMDVFENIAFPLRSGRMRLPKEDVEARVEEVLELVEIGTLKRRAVTTLSGGQQQRVGLARALALRPKVLLMDEPLSNLDFQLQVQLRGQLRALMHQLKLTTVHVTHNQVEALEMGDRIAVMDRGSIVQIGDGYNVYNRPVNEFVARFIGEMNLIPAVVGQVDRGLATLKTSLGSFAATVPQGPALAVGERCHLGIRPADVLLVPSISDNNAVEAEVIGRRFVGDRLVFELRAGDVSLETATHHSTKLELGSSVHVHLPPERSIAVRQAQPKDI